MNTCARTFTTVCCVNAVWLRRAVQNIDPIIIMAEGKVCGSLVNNYSVGTEVASQALEVLTVSSK